MRIFAPISTIFSQNLPSSPSLSLSLSLSLSPSHIRVLGDRGISSTSRERPKGEFKPPPPLSLSLSLHTILARVNCLPLRRIIRLTVNYMLLARSLSASSFRSGQGHLDILIERAISRSALHVSPLEKCVTPCSSNPRAPESRLRRRTQDER